MSSTAISARLQIRRALFPVVIMMLLAVIVMKPAHAQQKPLSPEYSAGFAFFKYAKIRPPFDQWVRASKRYADSTPRERVNMLRLEPMLLESRFDNYVSEENPIELRVRARISVPGKKRAEDLIERDGKVTIPIRLTGHVDDSFPLQVADMWIALIPTNLTEMITLALTKEQYYEFRKMIASTSITANAEAQLRITFLPTGADTKEPLRLNGFELWMLRVKITEIEIWDVNNKSMAWLMEAPGHKAVRKHSEIFNLYE